LKAATMVVMKVDVLGHLKAATMVVMKVDVLDHLKAETMVLMMVVTLDAKLVGDLVCEKAATKVMSTAVMLGVQLRIHLTKSATTKPHAIYYAVSYL
jgi:hypothetical protein